MSIQEQLSLRGIADVVLVGPDLLEDEEHLRCLFICQVTTMTSLIERVPGDEISSYLVIQAGVSGRYGDALRPLGSQYLVLLRDAERGFMTRLLGSGRFNRARREREAAPWAVPWSSRRTHT